MKLERLDWRVVLTLATVSMLLQQAFSYVCQLAMPFLADRLAEEFEISRAWLGVYLSLQNIAAICAALGCGALIVKVGALRISQWCLLCMGASLFVTATGSLWLYPLGAILLGAASVSTPASSHILARFCPPRLAPLVFSIKQTGVPVGSLISGVLFPALLGLGITIGFLDLHVELDAFGTAFVVGLIVYAMAVMLEPLRSHFDSDRKPDTGVDLAGVLRTMRHVVRTPELRDLSMVAFSLGGLQSIWAGFFILFVIDGLDRSEIEAGTMFATASLTAIGARILWGWLGTALVSPPAHPGGTVCHRNRGGTSDRALPAGLGSLADTRCCHSLQRHVAQLARLAAGGNRPALTRRHGRRCYRRCARIHVGRDDALPAHSTADCLRLPAPTVPGSPPPRFRRCLSPSCLHCRPARVRGSA